MGCGPASRNDVKASWAVSAIYLRGPHRPHHVMLMVYENDILFLGVIHTLCVRAGRAAAITALTIVHIFKFTAMYGLYFHTSVGQQLSRLHRKTQRIRTWGGAACSNPMSSAMRERDSY